MIANHHPCLISAVLVYNAVSIMGGG